VVRKGGDVLMPSDARGQSTTVGRCDLCGRETARPEAYRLLSRVVPLPPKSVSISLESTDKSSLTSETKFKTHDFSVCPRCHNRKTFYLVISLAMLAAWVLLAMKSNDPAFPLFGLVVILGFAIGSGRLLPVQRLARRIRRQRKGEVSAASPGLRFQVETLTPAAHQIRVQSPTSMVIVKRCNSCKTEVPASSEVGDRCPRCGVLWGWEAKRCGSCQEEMPVSIRVGDRCRQCGSRWGV